MSCENLKSIRDVPESLSSIRRAFLLTEHKYAQSVDRAVNYERLYAEYHLWQPRVFLHVALVCNNVHVV